MHQHWVAIGARIPDSLLYNDLRHLNYLGSLAINKIIPLYIGFFSVPPRRFEIRS